MNLNKNLNDDVKEKLITIQKESFKRHLQLALENNLALSVHARDINGKDRCVKDVIQLIAQEGKGLLRGCFHSYTGDIKFLEEILRKARYICRRRKLPYLTILLSLTSNSSANI
jgi:Tat protein secretion system quality control protein TatD with DNase activity